MENVSVEMSSTNLTMLQKWGEDDVYKLISLVEGEKCLWDVGEESYHNKLLCDRAWRNIAEYFDHKYTESDLCAKWTNLQSVFRYYNEKTKTESGQRTIEAPNWRFLIAMSFVGQVEDQQIQQMSLEVDSEGTSLDSEELSAPPATSRQQEVVISLSDATRIADALREAVVATQRHRENSFKPNESFANYMLSELNTLSSEKAASIRRKVAVFFFQCLDEETLEE